METNKRKLVYEGVKEVMNGKIMFMEQCMRFHAVREMIAERLDEDENLRQKLHSVTTGGGKEKMHHMALAREDFVLLYDTLYENRMKRLLENTEDSYILRCALPMQLDGTKMELDVTYFIVYGMMINPRCRKVFHEEADRWEELLESYERSDYKNKYFEKCFRVEDVWDARALVGLLEKMREEGEGGVFYQILMKIIYAGYGYMKAPIRGRKCITGCWIRDFLQDAFEQTRNMLSVVSQIFILLAIAEDLEVPYVWDYEMLVMFRSFQEFQEEMECGIGEHNGLQLFESTDYSEFLQKFDAKYGVHNSLFDLLSQDEEDPMEELLVRVMSLYDVNPRIFWDDGLSEKEVDLLLRQSREWSERDYWCMLVIAQLCKYIQKIEKAYLNTSKLALDRTKC